METWLIGVIAGGIGVLLLLIVIGIARIKARKKKQAKALDAAAAKAKAEVEAKAEKPKEEEVEISFNPVKSSVQRPHTEGVKVEEYDDYDDYDDEDDEEFDAELDEEVRRYREMMMRRMGNEPPRKPRELTDDEDFERFRNEHCYSKFFRDKTLADKLLNLPGDVKSIVFSNVFERKEFDDINFGDK